MQSARHLLICGAVLALFFYGLRAAHAGDDVAAAAHFALIRPEADASSDQPEPTADAAWLRRPRKTGRNASSTSSSKKTKSLASAGEKREAGVAPLNRNRPKSEINPPKTRRRQLGW